jgi:hypothetical protein
MWLRASTGAVVAQSLKTAYIRLVQSNPKSSNSLSFVQTTENIRCIIDPRISQRRLSLTRASGGSQDPASR